MRLRHCLLFPVLAAFLLPVRAQDGRRMNVISRLAGRQEQALVELRQLLGDVEILVRDLRRRGEDEKADLLQQAVAIVREERIGFAAVKGSGATARMLGDLERAMTEMARILKERPDATEEVQDIGQRVVATLEEVVHVLTGNDDLKSLEEREQELQDARAEAARLTDRQRELREQTRRTVPRTPAERAAAKAAQDLGKLAKQIDRLDRRARDELKELDAARERAARLQDLLARQQRLKRETAVRAGRTDTLTPQINLALAELEAIARAAREAERNAAERGARGEMARRMAGLARRQREIAEEIDARTRLEKARDALNGDLETAKKALQQAAEVAPQEADALRRAARALDAGGKLQEKAQEKARNALRAALARTASRETLARDEKTVARDAERARAKVPAAVADALEEAAKEARDAARSLEQGDRAGAAARRAADRLREAVEMLTRDRPPEGEASGAKGGAEKRVAAAARADAVAKELAALASREETKKAGLESAAGEAAEAARRAAEELRRAAEATRKGDPEAAARRARAAAERVEKASRDLDAELEEGEDLLQRQRNVSEDLGDLADRAKDAGRKGSLKAAAQSAQQAVRALRKSDFNAAGAKQQEVLDRLSELTRQAAAEAAATAQRQADALQRAQQATQKAADRAAKIAKELSQGARSAQENDSRRRIEEARQRTEAAEKALRRSLRRLEQAMPKSAEQDRQEARDEIEKARESLSGLREAHRNPDGATRQNLKRIGERQRDLQEEVKRLETRLKRLKENSGVERLQDAQSAMREAKQRLDEGGSDEAERAQQRAEKALQQAQQELDREERRYRALRQYELLFKLKEELKGFRRAAQAHRETLQRIDADVRRAGRVTRRIRKGDLEPLRRQVKTLQGDVGDKAAAVEKEGAVVYTFILKGCARDLSETEAQLALKEVGLVPQELLGDVVRRFDLAIKGLERDLQERRKDQEQKQQKQGQGQQPGNIRPRLVPRDAEIRMVMVLQKALNEERENFFTTREDFGKRPTSASEKARVERLYHQQGSLAELFDSLKASIVGQDEEPAFPEEEGEGEEK